MTDRLPRVPPGAPPELAAVLARMSFEVVPGRFALVGFAAAPAPEDLAALGEGPAQLVREGGETTLLLPVRELPAVLARHPGAASESPLVWVRFRAPMGWELVGFLAHVTGSLAAAGVPLGAVCGFSRDHLFLHERFLDPALAVLDSLFERAPTP